MSLLPLLVFVVLGADPVPSIRLPNVKAAVAPVTVTVLAVDSLFVIDADEPYMVLDSRQEIVRITEDVGPMTIRSVFVDGTGKPETRKYTAKYIWLIEAVQAGEVEIIITKVGEKDRTKAIRRTLLIGGVTPKPRPNDPIIPKPIDPRPDDPKPDPLPIPLGLDKIIKESVRKNVPAAERAVATKLAEAYREGAKNLANGTWSLDKAITNQRDLNVKVPGYKADSWRGVFRDVADVLAAARDAGRFESQKQFVAVFAELSLAFAGAAE